MRSEASPGGGSQTRRGYEQIRPAAAFLPAPFGGPFVLRARPKASRRGLCRFHKAGPGSGGFISIGAAAACRGSRRPRSLGILLICFPFFLVDVPPLIDVPGHMGAAAIEAAGPDSPLGKYLGWKWVFTLNIGGDVLMKVLGEPLGVLAAGWWSTVIATALFAGGAWPRCAWSIRAAAMARLGR
jgi:hypothetical protein